MKKLMLLGLVLTVGFALTGCTDAVDYSEDIDALETEIATLKQTVADLEGDIEDLQNVPEPVDKVELNIAMITDSGTIDDESFNQGTWEGIVEYAEANGHVAQYYKPTEVSDTAYLAAIQLAVLDGADVVVTPGFLFESAVYEAQFLFPSVYFILIDGVPHTPDWATFETGLNTLSILFNEHESGFLAGYAAVMDGYRHLGYIGGMAVPAVVKFGVGYVAGAYYAANELSVDITLGDDDYHYLGSFAPSDTAKAFAKGWFTAGTEIIFSAAGGAGGSVMAAAEEVTGAKTIGVDVDQYYLSDTVITSALKGLGVAVKTALADIEAGTFEGGRTLTLGAAEMAVGLPMENSVFATFTDADYAAVLEELVDMDIIVPVNYTELVAFLTANGNPTGIPTQAVVEPS